MFCGKLECPLLGESGRSIAIRSDAVCKIWCRLLQPPSYPRPGGRRRCAGAGPGRPHPGIPAILTVETGGFMISPCPQSLPHKSGEPRSKPQAARGDRNQDGAVDEDDPKLCLNEGIVLGQLEARLRSIRWLILTPRTRWVPGAVPARRSAGDPPPPGRTRRDRSSRMPLISSSVSVRNSPSEVIPSCPCPFPGHPFQGDVFIERK